MNKTNFLGFAPFINGLRQKGPLSVEAFAEWIAEKRWGVPSKDQKRLSMELAHFLVPHLPGTQERWIGQKWYDALAIVTKELENSENEKIV